MTDETDAIAVVGLALRVPGARDSTEFWANALSGTISLSTVDAQPPMAAPGTWVPVKGCLEGADEFDAEFFGYSPREAELTDPQQRVFLELAWHALEDAGHTPDSAGTVGIYASATQSQYARLLDHHGGVDELQARIATDSDFLATRAAYKMDLRGPAITVQTACSSSLVAVHMAVSGLLAGDCDTAIAGGVTITLPLRGGYWHQPGSILSPDGRCRAFDAQAAGTVPGNGAGAVVLRRLGDAIADGDDIYAVVLGSALTNDGHDKIGFTAPSADGQSAAISRALAVAGVDPHRVGMVEAHGTGTTLGDPIEVAALRRIFGERADGSWCALSATKTNIGHLDAAAGIAGFIKAVLSVRAGVIPPIAGLTQPNPDLRLSTGSLRVAATATPWPVPGRRYAGVSAFGVGGTNAHAVLAQAPPRPAQPPRPDGPITLALTARDENALNALAAALAEYLEAEPDVDLRDVAYTLAAGRLAMRIGRTFTADDRAALIELLRTDRTAQAPQPLVSAEGRRVHLPGYPFQRQRFWIAEPPHNEESTQPAADGGTTWIAEIFRDVLGTAPTDAQQSFFDLGGDSLMAVQLLGRVEAACGVEPDLADFFDDPTVAGLAAQLTAQRGNPVR